MMEFKVIDGNLHFWVDQLTGYTYKLMENLTNFLSPLSTPYPKIVLRHSRTKGSLGTPQQWSIATVVAINLFTEVHAIFVEDKDLKADVLKHNEENKK